MPFDSLTFLLFFVAVLAISNAIRAWTARKSFLLAASWLFYAAWNPPFVLLLMFSSTLDWWLAQRMAGLARPTDRLPWLRLSLAVNLGILATFKYQYFILGNVAWSLEHFGIHWQAPDLGLALPVGISFYTFQSISYAIDVYRGRETPIRSWRDYSLYVAFFPQLVAGPIVRFHDMRAQLAHARGTTLPDLGIGISLMVLGLFQKIVLADGIFAPVADAAYADASRVTALGAWVGTLAFAGQIFCDFAGYSTTAIGAARCLGFHLPLNFRFPYASIGFSDFWRRWHISLSTWLRDYLYIALGGNRLGRWLTLRNLLLTMLIGGLWHGAAWHFVIWGGLHGTWLVIERVLADRGWFNVETAGRLGRMIWAGLTLIAVVYTWVWFRATDLEHAIAISRALSDGAAFIAAWPTRDARDTMALLGFATMVAVHWAMRSSSVEDLITRTPGPLLVVALGLMGAAIVLSPGTSHAFIYFQF
ncbi:MAG: MBOAT family protein [Xanthomonadales bacterium]|jgi:alginate O-acetyltransferase complex protein AlgI|nr:MBOAT family protein [Xanthomonadales bacterium]